MTFTSIYQPHTHTYAERRTLAPRRRNQGREQAHLPSGALHRPPGGKRGGGGGSTSSSPILQPSSPDGQVLDADLLALSLSSLNPLNPERAIATPLSADINFEVLVDSKKPAPLLSHHPAIGGCSCLQGGGRGGKRAGRKTCALPRERVSEMRLYHHYHILRISTHMGTYIHTYIHLTGRLQHTFTRTLYISLKPACTSLPPTTTSR